MELRNSEAVCDPYKITLPLPFFISIPIFQRIKNKVKDSCQSDKVHLKDIKKLNIDCHSNLVVNKSNIDR